ncbi:hypothetical protein AYI70_g2511 [Smittium culicis]|uniref:CCHC-type domain-containing protein n=1 Tax=Smittium culicis TaxID=133412 RepID=A0A1R1Y807_9FUNG|nr:hypothetical protein AYI70_g2511 [Smittium culicis]
MSYTKLLRKRAAWLNQQVAKGADQADMVIQPGPFKLKGPVTEPKELEILIVDKHVDTGKKFNLEVAEDNNGCIRESDILQVTPVTMEAKYSGTRYYTPGSALRKPLNTEWVDMTPEEKILESARAVRDKAETKKSDFVLLAPAPFYGHWKENATTWMQRFIRHVDSTKRPLLNEELVEYVGYQLEGRAKWWHRSASQLYPDWEQYVESFIYEFHPSKNKKIAKEKLKEFKIYNGDLLENYANIVSIFKVLGTTDVDEQVDILLEKLNRQDRETVVQLNLLTTFQIFDLLIGRKERDRRFGGSTSGKESNNSADGLNTGHVARRIELTSAVKETRSCYKCDKVGHLASDCPDRFEPRNFEYNSRRLPINDRRLEGQRIDTPDYTPVRDRFELANKSKESRARMLESRMKRLGGIERNGEVNALQIGTSQKLQSGEYTGIGGIVKINHRYITWQLDTGSGFNVISEQLAKELGFKEDEEESAVLVSANGTKNTSQSIKNVALEFSGLKTTADFYTMASGRNNLLLIGLQTLQELEATVDIKQEKIKMRKDGKTYDIGLKYIHKGDIPKLGTTVYTLEKNRLDGEFISKDLSPNKRNDIVGLVWKHRDVFAEELEDLGIAENGIQPDIETGESEVLILGQTDKREEYKNLYETTKANFSSEELIDATRRRFYERDGELYFKEGNKGKLYPRPERITGGTNGARSKTETKEIDISEQQKLGRLPMASFTSNKNQSE